MIDEKGIFEVASIQEQYIAALPFYPINVQTNKTVEEGFLTPPTIETDSTDPSAESQSEETTGDGMPAPILAETTIPDVSATSG